METYIPLTGFVLIALSGSPLLAQGTDPDDLLEEPDILEEQLLENILSEGEESSIADRILWLQEHPLDLNTAGKSELETIPGISSFEAGAIVDFRRAVKKLTRIDQVELIPGMSADLLERIRPFVFVSGAQERTPAPVVRVRSRAVRDLQPRRGFMDNSFSGSSLKSYTRMGVESGQMLKAGILFEKDPGEKPSNGFTSGFVAASGILGQSRILVGDYLMETGQGLVFWRASAFGKGSETIDVSRKRSGGVVPYRSSDEFSFFRGGAATYHVAMEGFDIHMTGAFSRRSLGATLITPDSVSGFYTAGLFRTETELGKRNLVSEEIIGSHVRLRSSGGLSVGASYLRARFDRGISPRNVFDHGGKKIDILGIDGEVEIGTMTMFGEVARARGGDAAILGALWHPGRRMQLSAVYRNYSPGFVNYYANGFGERSDTRNERGLYLGGKFFVRKGIVLRVYLDQFMFPWSTPTIPLPVSGVDMFAETSVRFTPRFDITFRYARKQTEGTASETDPLGRSVRIVVARIQDRARVTATYHVSRSLRLKGRMEGTEVRYRSAVPGESGLLFYYDIQFRPSQSLSLDARFAVFDTDSYDSRTYEYENDVRGVFSNPALYGKGRRWYLLSRYKLGTFVSISAKYAETYKEGVRTIGSGSSEIVGDVDNRLTLQIEMSM